MTKVLSEADKVQVQKNENAPAPAAAEKKSSIKQRAAMFEPKNSQPQGPSIGWSEIPIKNLKNKAVSV